MKQVDIFAYEHNGGDAYMDILPEDRDLFIIEDLSHKKIEDALHTLSLRDKEKKNSFEKKEYSYLRKLQKKEIKMVIGDRSHSDEVIDKRISTIGSTINLTTASAAQLCTLESIKDFYRIFAEEFSLRNHNFIHNILNNESQYVGVRFGTAHSIICQELKSKGHDLFIAISPTEYGYGMTLARKLYLGITVSDDEYIKAWRADMLAFVSRKNYPQYHKNIFGKVFDELTQKDRGMIYPFFNALVDSYAGDISSIKEYNLMKLFTSQGFQNPTIFRIPRQQIRDFLKNFSIKKYGTTVYYDRLERQGMIY